MPLIPDDQLPAMFQDVAAGRRRLIAWGAVEDAAFFQWHCPLPLHCYIDTNWVRWGDSHCGVPIRSPSILETEDPAATVVVVHYHLSGSLPHLCAFMDRLGPFDYFMPRPLAATGADDGRSPWDLAGVIGRDPVAADKPALFRALADGLRGDHWRRFGQLVAEYGAEQSRRQDAVPRSAVLFVEALHLGGAERQLCQLAVGLHERGWRSTVAFTREAPPESAHYLDFLRRKGVEYGRVGLDDPPPPAGAVADLVERVGERAALILWHLPPSLISTVLALTLFLRRVRPALVVCYLDRPNIMGGLAAVLAGVPSILLSGRNVNPTHFPHFYGGQTDTMRHVYQALLPLPGVRLATNSRVGAQSYGPWLGLESATVPVIPNAVAQDLLDPPPPGVADGMRALLGIAPERRVVLGLFRLAPEKRPLLFVEVIARLARTVPQVQGVICGTGSLERAVLDRAAELGILDRILLVRGVANVAAALSLSRLVLHVSEFEGTPNALLEAQAQSVPVVCTRTGGTEDALAPDLRPFCHDGDDVDGLAESCRRLLTDDDLNHHLGQAARDHVLAHHTLAGLVDRTLAVVGAEP